MDLGGGRAGGAAGGAVALAAAARGAGAEGRLLCEAHYTAAATPEVLVRVLGRGGAAVGLGQGVREDFYDGAVAVATAPGYARCNLTGRGGGYGVGRQGFGPLNRLFYSACNME